MPLLAINSSISLFLVFAVRKMISSIVSLDRLGPLEDLSDDGRVAWIGKSRHGGVDTKIVESRQN
ncbi:MAG: hypothetical protein A2X81_10525 [Desulfobacterales bacterium GWB2_56_26]|nr:MAG: hypothetical protein A2X81_10525 [Desulfobacterales bacterium GWB2_56_26]